MPGAESVGDSGVEALLEKQAALAVGVDALLEKQAALQRDVATVWTLQRSFEERMLANVVGWAKDIENMRDGVINEIQHGQGAVVDIALQQTRSELASANTRLRAAEERCTDIELRCAEADGRLASLEDVEQRLLKVEGRCAAAEKRADAAESATDADVSALRISAEKQALDHAELERRVSSDAKAAKVTARRAKPVHAAIRRLAARLAAALAVDDAATLAAAGDDAAARASLKDLWRGLPRQHTAPAELLRRLSRTGSAGGERLAANYGFEADASGPDTALAKRRQIRRASRGSLGEKAVSAGSVCAAPGDKAAAAAARRKSAAPATYVVGDGDDSTDSGSERGDDEAETCVLADSILAILRRVSAVEAEKVEQAAFQTLHATVDNVLIRLDGGDKRADARFSAVERKAREDTNSHLFKADELQEAFRFEKGRVSELTKSVASVASKLEKMEEDHFGQVEAYLQPTIDTVESNTRHLDLVSRETRAALASMDANKAQRSELSEKADAADVEGKASNDALQCLSSSVSTMSATLELLAGRVESASTASKRGQAASDKVDALILELRKRMSKPPFTDAPPGKPAARAARAADADSVKTRDSARTKDSEGDESTNARLAPLPASPRGGASPSGASSYDARSAPSGTFRASASQPALRAPAISLHCHRESWHFPKSEVAGRRQRPTSLAAEVVKYQSDRKADAKRIADARRAQTAPPA
ncbi:hypothetical protein M885DRAFT_513427 [Pelagophyceae sp. CCMP2097]|nr:hypothetical protein M885DRAFT_513427 [Pelagophyceae sp. CCMP2097]